MTTFFLHWYNIQSTQAKHDQLIENLPDQRIVKIQDVLENLTCLISKKKKKKKKKKICSLGSLSSGSNPKN